MCKFINADHRKQRGRTAPNKFGMIYDVGDRPPIGKMFLFAFQMLLSVFVASVLIANICGMDVSAALVGAGCSTLIYIAFTAGKSPMFISNSGAFVAPVIMAVGIAGYTGVAIGGVTTCCIYILIALFLRNRDVKNINLLFPPTLVGAVTMVIGINLMGFIPTYLGETGQWGIIIALITAVVIAVLSHFTEGIWKLIPFLLGTGVGYIISIILTLTGVCQLIDFSVFEDITFFVIPKFAFIAGYNQAASLETLLPIIVTYIAFTLSAACELLSDHAALGKIIGTDLYETPGLTRLFIGEGMANLGSSLIGGLGACSYGEGVACVGFSKVASVWVTGTAAIMLAALGFIGPVQAVIASIPACVFAGAAIILYGFIACSGVKMLQHIDLNEQKNLILVSAVLSIGLGGVAIGTSKFSLSGTALAVVVGILLNLLLFNKKVRKTNESTN